MYGTVAKIKAKPGQGQAIADLMDDWNKDRKDQVEGAVAGYLYKLDQDSDRLIMVAVFEDKATYLRNAGDPAQDSWYQKLRQLLAEDPEWNDGEIISSS